MWKKLKQIGILWPLVFCINYILLDVIEDEWEFVLF